MTSPGPSTPSASTARTAAPRGSRAPAGGGAAAVAVGVSVGVAMAVADAELVARGWVADGALTDTGRAERDAVEARTDAAMDRVLAPVDDLAGLTSRLDAWSERVVAGGGAPRDPYKRVSG